MKPTGQQRAIGLLLAAVAALLFIWLINSGAKQLMGWLTDLPNKQQSDVRVVIGILLALVLPLAAYRLRRGRGKTKR
ncbi:hypothetical protein CDN98_00485 [Roseateles terrae]|nr:hypothetical protein CDN98_00485 [Roseateles terrae]